MTKANELVRKYKDVNQLMDALAKECAEIENDYEKESTTWTLSDGSEVTIFAPCSQSDVFTRI